MKIRTDFPHPTREVEHFWIPLPDGCRLSARMWLPTDAEEHPVPAVLIYMPYRKSDSYFPGLGAILGYLAGCGYAALWIDIRGSGESDGLLTDEYSDQELTDGVEAIGWLAEQPWCTGDVGMWGGSWSGCNTLQVAARRPPALRAVLSLCSMVDLYDEDLYYWGGCLLGLHLDWATTLHALMAQPPQPALFGEGWRATWHERLEYLAGFVETKLGHQRRDGYWKRASICEDYCAITCPVYMVGGWADGYVSAIPRFLAGYAGPKKALIGPWGHGLPYLGGPGPAIGFLQESLRWWDYWLKGIDTGIMDEPMLRAWLSESIEPRVQYDEKPGRWVAEPTWPSPSIEPRTLALNPGSLDEEALAETPLTLRSPLRLGSTAGPWMVYARAPDFPPDQREDDALSLAFTSPALAEPLELLGFPEVTLAIATDRPNALVAVRLCDVAQNGESTLITRGLLNLTHRESHEHPTPLEPGQRYRVTVQLRAVGQVVSAGHRLRIAISSTYWPFAWPSPETATLTVFAGPESSLILPIRKARPEDTGLRPFEEAETAPPLPTETLRTFQHSWTTERDVVAGRYETAYRTDGGRWRHVESGIEYGYTSNLIATIVEGNPLSARVRFERSIDLGRGDWRTRIELTNVTTGDRDTFRVAMVLDAYEGDTRAFTRTWNLAIARDLV
jgi:putative CocE/NonD family hydrolase